MHLAPARRTSAIVCATATATALTSLLTAVPTQAVQADKLTVAADGSGQYRTVQAAIDAVPANSPTQVTIEIKPGTYRGVISIPSSKPNIRLAGLGSSPASVVIVENHFAGGLKPDGRRTVPPAAPPRPSAGPASALTTSPSPTTSTKPPTPTSQVIRPSR
jgi:pectin methylesterase-like acyl-CoA thioesterase